VLRIRAYTLSLSPPFLPSFLSRDCPPHTRPHSSLKGERLKSGESRPRQLRNGLERRQRGEDDNSCPPHVLVLYVGGGGDDPPERAREGGGGERALDRRRWLRVRKEGGGRDWTLVLLLSSDRGGAEDARYNVSIRVRARRRRRPLSKRESSVN